jgi:hypothetical protein
MKHTVDELLDIVYRYYPRGVGIVDGDLDVQAIHVTEEHARLVAARGKAATDERWRAMRRRIEERFPEAWITDYSLHLQTGDDACYSFAFGLRDTPGDRALWVRVSILVPYYIIHGSGTADVVKEQRKDIFTINFRGFPFEVSRSLFDPKLISNVVDEMLKPVTIKRPGVVFDLLPDERPYAEWIAREIETTFGYEPLPPEVGTVRVPALATPQLPGKARLYDCLFSWGEWGAPPPSDVPAPVVTVDANHLNLTEPFMAVLTVLAALYHILLTLIRERQGAFSVGMTTDGILHKEDALKILAGIRHFIELPVTPRGIAGRREIEAATREIEAMIAAWDGEGAPSDAMVAWASSLLARWGGVAND